MTNSKRIEGMYLETFMKFFENLHKGHSCSSKSVKKYKVREVGWLIACIDFMHVIIFINLNRPVMDLGWYFESRK